MDFGIHREPPRQEDPVTQHPATGHPLAHATALADLVDWQPGPVVSRVLHRSAGGVVTLFAFDAGEGLTEHTNPNDAIVQIVEGSLRITVGGTERRMARGDVLHMPPGAPHRLHGGPRFKMLLTLLRPGAR